MNNHDRYLKLIDFYLAQQYNPYCLNLVHYMEKKSTLLIIQSVGLPHSVIEERKSVSASFPTVARAMNLYDHTNYKLIWKIIILAKGME